MEKKTYALIAALIIIVGVIVFFESMKTEYAGDIVVGEEINILDTFEAPETATPIEIDMGVKDTGAEENDNVSTEKPKKQGLTQDDLDRIEIKKGKYKSAIELVDPDDYINTDPLKIRDLIGKQVILVDFWTYSCINCQRTLPFLTAWHNKYKDQGLTIIGVHTPEFEFEKVYDNVVTATKKFGVEYPVVLDNNYYTWRAYNNRYWPRKYLIDIDGFIVYDHIGEGAYTDTEMKIQKALMEREEVLGLDKKELPGVKVVVQPKMEEFLKTFKKTKELYAGYKFAEPREQDVGNEGGMIKEEKTYYALPTEFKEDVIYLKGEWISKPDYLLSQGKTSIVLDYLATSVNIVGDTLANPVRVEVSLDGAYISKDHAGKDVKFDGEKAYIVVDRAGLYEVVDGNYGRHELRLETDSTGFYFNSFTFG